MEKVNVLVEKVEMIAWLDRVLPLWRVMLFGVAKSERRKVGSCTGFEMIDGELKPIDWRTNEDNK